MSNPSRSGSTVPPKPTAKNGGPNAGPGFEPDDDAGFGAPGIGGHPVPDLIGPIPRRKKITAKDDRISTVSLPPDRTYSPNPYQVSKRLLAWAWRAMMFLTLGWLDRLLRRDSRRRRANRLRIILQRLGPTAIKVGQQLSVRADLFPSEYCDELAKMLDLVPPFKFEFARKQIAKTIRCPLDRVFRRIDPDPIGSASLACVFQAQLLNGTLVAIKVKRPDIGNRMAADLKAISWICKVAENLGIIRPGLTRNLQLELSRMFSEEIDFSLEARYTEIFRRDAKKCRHVSAPRVFFEFSDYDVLVTEFVSGVFLSEILTAIETEDQAAMAELRRRGFNPEIIAKRMNQVFLWECFESNFFHADPHPANIIVKPDNMLVMIDFGSCGSISDRMRQRLLSFNRALVTDNLNGMVQDTIAMLEPLPHFDVHSYYIDLMNIYRETFIAHKSKHAPWYDKCSGGMWMKVIAMSQKYRLPMTLDTVRIFRASFMYDSIVYRLHPRMNAQREFRKWAEHWNAQNRRRTLQAARDRVFGPLDSDFTRAQEMTRLLDSAMQRFQRFIDQPSYNFAYTIGKVAYAISVTIKTAFILIGLVMVVSAARLITGIAADPQAAANVDFFNAVLWTLNNKLVILFGTLYLIVATRKVLFKIQDVDIS